MPEASVGVASPARIEPSVAAISPSRGTTPMITSRTMRRLLTRSDLGTGGPSFGLMKARPAR